MISFSDSVYRQNNLICMLQDLKNLFVYWDLRVERIYTLNNFRNRIKPGANIKLCLCNDQFILEPGEIRQEVMIDDLEPGNYYFRDINPEQNYHFELGIQDTDGQFILFARTSSVELNPAKRATSDLISDEGANMVTIPLNFTNNHQFNDTLTSSWS